MTSQIDCAREKGKQGFPFLIDRICEVHKKNKLAFIHTAAESSDGVLKCQDCIIDECLNPASLLSLSQVSSSNEFTVFRNWPVPGDNELYEKLKDLLMRPKKNSRLEEEVNIYFKQLKSTVMSRIEVIHEQTIKKAQDILMEDQKILQKYSQMSAKDDLKRILSDTSTDTKTLSSRIREIIDGVQANKQQNAESLNNSIFRLYHHDNLVDFEVPKGIQKDILSNIEKLTMFPWNNSQRNPDLGNQFDFMLSKFQNSSELKLQLSQEGVTVIQENSLVGQAVTSNNLFNHLVYTLKCTFNKPFNTVQKGQSIRVGLILEDEIDQQGLGSLDHNHFTSVLCQGTKNTLKGQQLNEEPLRSTITTFYFKICIHTQTFLVMDETHTNVNQAKKEAINQTQKYRFGIRFYSPGNNYKCLISLIKASSDLTTADSF